MPQYGDYYKAYIVHEKAGIDRVLDIIENHHYEHDANVNVRYFFAELLNIPMNRIIIRFDKREIN